MVLKIGSQLYLIRLEDFTSSIIQLFTLLVTTNIITNIDKALNKEREYSAELASFGSASLLIGDSESLLGSLVSSDSGAESMSDVFKLSGRLSPLCEAHVFNILNDSLISVVIDFVEKHNANVACWLGLNSDVRHEIMLMIVFPKQSEEDIFQFHSPMFS